MRRKALYSIVTAVILLGASIWYFPNHIWTTVHVDAHSDPDQGIRVGEATWKSLGGAMIDELSVNYSSADDARKAFEEEIADKQKTIERTKGPVDERVVMIMGDPRTKQGAAFMTRLRDRNINYINSESLKYALAFEESLLKPW